VATAAAKADADPALPIELPAAVASLPPEVRAAELRRLADALHAEADRLDGGHMTTQEAAEAIGRSEENVRQWVRRFGVGYYDSASHRYWVSKSKLRAHMLEAYGRLPHGLAGRF
jgi:hypothetical protein